MPAGYSKTPLAKKLGIKQGFKIRLINTPENYLALFDDMPDVEFMDGPMGIKNFIHLFASRGDQLLYVLPGLKNEITANGIIWVSWPKKASKIVTDVSESLVRDLALKNGLVDIKVCAVEDIWSGLKLVIPVKDRK